MVRQAHHERTFRQTAGVEWAYESSGHMNPVDLRFLMAYEFRGPKNAM